MLLNKIPVLDKGYVALIDSTLNKSTYTSTIDEFFQSQDRKELNNFKTAIFAIKAPIFVKLHLAQHGFKILSSTSYNEVEAFIPSVGEIGAATLEVNRAIADDIERTTEALLINPAAYQADGCNRFISQLITPINVYSVFLASGNASEWISFTTQGSKILPIRSYIDAIDSILKTYWS
jgi:hypothetical protein